MIGKSGESEQTNFIQFWAAAFILTEGYEKGCTLGGGGGPPPGGMLGMFMLVMAGCCG